MTQEVVSQEPVSTEEPVSPPAEPVKPAEALTEERVQQLIAEATARAVESGKQFGRRELQSQQDRNAAEVARASRRAQVTENTLGAVRSHLQSYDPEVAKEMELAELRAERQGRMSLEQEERLQQQQEVDGKALQESLYAHLETLGIDAGDTRIDWAEDSNNYTQGRSRFDASVAKIVKEEKQTMQSGLEQRLRDLEARINQANIDVNSVEATTSGGVVAGSDAEFMNKFGAGDLPASKENIARYEKIKEKYE